MNIFVSLVITYWNNIPKQSLFYYNNHSTGYKFNSELDPETARKVLRRLEKRFGCSASLNINQFDNTICYKEIYGILPKNK